ncbi:MAG: RluA family pseudouridine synthase [Verrucomicrobiae bacterium]|nr:RluA family pseudouridine synthase [Verrucomicrobiae bacterium]
MDMDRVLFVDEAGLRVDQWLVKKNPELTRSRIQQLIRGSCILVNQKSAKSSIRVRIGDEITIHFPPMQSLNLKPEEIALQILYEDDEFLAINKPQGLVVHPAPGHSEGTLVNALLHHCRGSLSGIGGVERPGIVHRLDKETSGVLLVTKTDKAHQALSQQFKDRKIQKFYQVLAQSFPKKSEGEIISAIERHPVHRKKMAVSKKGKLAITRYKIIEKFKAASFLECQILTGRTHQIRVHLLSIGCPVLGDKLYGKVASQAPRQMLHARRLIFQHPLTKKEMVIEAGLPEDFIHLLEQLRHGKNF